MPFFRSVSALILGGFVLAACVPDPAMIEAGLVEAPAPKLAPDTAYGSIEDAGLILPAVPVEKVPDEFQRQTVFFETDQPKGTVIINPADKHLYLVTGRNQALRYGIAVGRAGFQWSGEALITERKPWPTWTPPEEMIERDPKLEKWKDGQPGGLTNPLGARALYLTTDGVDYGYRIHGTPEWSSIGRNASSGCIRMINQDVIDLYARVEDGAKVIVLNADGSMPKGLNLPPPQPKKPDPVVVVPAITILPPPKFDVQATSPEPAAAEPAAAEPAVANPPALDPALCLVKNEDGSCLCPVLLVNGLCPVDPLTGLPLQGG